MKELQLKEPRPYFKRADEQFIYYRLLSNRSDPFPLSAHTMYLEIMFNFKISIPTDELECYW